MSKRFVQDNDGHWYLIPHTEVVMFHSWVYAMDENEDWEGIDYWEYNCNHPSNYVVEVKEE